ncbi:MAG: glycosyltransferase family 2 protein [Chloroflexi bacterium AL-W]|nr:glycosyltransferase family 2 protein [Chloroflexi bacterium AL-N1]NOK65953.1 glycosyltransferase family 2 protein [Chloroflexi bacterium AL-N10]NOK72834.1 glycosyltransferase family 2 protein [Chloroflexi bacterium AL-N5]NOK79731.1 glycosyltransferase family 2 protein [Chloroflexi bacterium AL-W]NOK88413.1 glycosyltransferase family 2 protein [Chloroflexi bacterium AL-N15]
MTIAKPTGQPASIQHRASLSVAIIARDEERHIGQALASVADLATEIVTLVTESTRDRTASICRSYGAALYIEPWRGFPAQRNRALALCNNDWVLFLDADERVPPTLADEIRTLLATDHGAPLQSQTNSRPIAGYWIPRYNQFFGKILHGGGWYPDHQLRLLRRGYAHFDESRLVHEFAQLDGEAEYVHEHLLHLNIEHADELWFKQRSYAIQEAHVLYREGRRARLRNLVGAPLREFRRRYFGLGGYKDGSLGLFLCATMAYFEFVKYIHLMGLALLRRPT